MQQQGEGTGDQPRTITHCRIHPAIGIARVGDSNEACFYGPERPGVSGLPPGGRYKDGAGRIKRQAARFRVFGYDASGHAVGELTEAEAAIEWTVHLANRKAAAPLFGGGEKKKGVDRAAGLRNPKVLNRASLVIDPGERTIGGRNVRDGKYRFDSGTFAGVEVDLGELRTDEDGRLVVLGGHGRSESPKGRDLPTFADNDGWFDDTSDGPVSARVKLWATGETLVTDPAWVIVAPPDFAPSIGNVVTLHDVVEQVAFESGMLPALGKVSFERDILPFLRRVAGYQWVDETAYRGHRRGDHGVDDGKDLERRGDFLDQALLKDLATPGPGPAAAARRHVFDRVRAPLPSGEPSAEALGQAEEQATASFMPPLSGDRGTRTEGVRGTWLTVTPLQYARLKRWSDGDFEVGDQATIGILATPADLDRAALDSCVGGGFFPGIEVSRRIREGALYADAYRLDHNELAAGALTERMAVPWQADFFDCEGFWWPAQRPDRVVVDEDYRTVLSGSKQKDGRSGPFADALAYPRRRWARGIDEHRGMVDGWSKLGFVVPRQDNGTVWTETERDPRLGEGEEVDVLQGRPEPEQPEELDPGTVAVHTESDPDHDPGLNRSHREYFQIMLNLDRHPGFGPTAKKLAARFFDAADQKLTDDDDLDTELNFFEYDEVTFRTRLDSIYRYLVDQVAAYDPAEDGTCHSRDDVTERIRQFGPLNRTDGEWLRNISKVQSHNAVTGLLTRIWDDELGGGDPLYNHSNIYTELMRSVGLATPDVASKEYCNDSELLESAFTVPLLQYVASEFTDEFLPEIIGMTLYLEWESVGLKTVVELFRRYGIDANFYQLHMAIDNVAEGHGAMAVQAARLYLAGLQGADRQRQWRRIWRGYVAFRETGTLGQDLKDKLAGKRKPTAGAKAARVLGLGAVEERVLEMIRRKKPYGNLNHGGVTATGMSNDLFDDPEHMLAVLKERKIVVAGDPGASRLLALFDIDQPMYRVFTDEEQQLWRDWIASLPPEPAPLPPEAAPVAPVPVGAAAAPRHHKRLLLSSSEEAVRADSRSGLRGPGAVQ